MSGDYLNFFGIDITEWAGFFASLGVVASFILWVYKKAISEPNDRNNQALTNQIKDLSEAIKKLSDNTDGLKNEVNSHKVTLTNHEDRIEDLEEKASAKKRRNYFDK